MSNCWRQALVFLCLAFTSPVVLPANPDLALYWSLSREGEPAGYLLGTIHSEDPRVLDFSDEFLAQLGSNQVFAMELVPDLPTMRRLTEYMHYQDGTTLESMIGPERYSKLRTALSEYSVPEDWFSRMKVWAAMMTLSVPPPETGFFMDFSLSLRAAGSGLKVVGLETLEQQLAFLEQMPLEQQLALLDQALNDYDKVAQIHTQMVDHYVEGNLEELQAQSDEQLSQLEPELKHYFLEQGIDNRNLRMVETLLPYLQQGPVFVAVGALHLPGDTGLIELLRRNGYELQPLEPPFSAPENRGQANDQRNHEEADTP